MLPTKNNSDENNNIMTHVKEQAFTILNYYLKIFMILWMLIDIQHIVHKDSKLTVVYASQLKKKATIMKGKIIIS